ncbi:proline-rich receptor-like protein kinase PERK14 [Solanum pennellii]|uniref:Proline-rich receptor-like protein kinase PERK14 n=1 Tax=Solanum pennellii TaxID=28526 RepID=A0ABM1GT14_SOLPN|nr:proline-rich receptor-like protein kinase PERK14 [Solanum pennellii]
MFNPLVAYSDDENSSDNASSQGEENPSTDTVLAQGEENQPTNKPSTSSPSSPKSDQPTSPPPPVTKTSPPPVTESPPPPVIESPPPPVKESPLPPNPETPITTTTKNPSSSPSLKQVRPHRTVTRSANVVKPTDGATSSGKRRRLGKSPVHSSVSPIVLDSESDDGSEGKNSETPQSKSNCKKKCG